MIAVASSPAVLSTPVATDLVHRGETLRERLAAALPISDPALGDGACRQLLAPWSRAFARGDYGSLCRRLGWDGWQPSRAAALFCSRPAPLAALPVWAGALSELIVCARQLAAEIESGRPFAPRPLAATKIPFAELWEPWVRAAAARLEASAEPALDRLAPSARAELAAQLLAQLARLGELAAQEQLELRRRREPAAAGHYRRFVLDALHDPLGQLYLEFPVLARLCAETVRQWHEAVLELARRLGADQTEIAATFAKGGSPGRVVGIEDGLSDRHDDGRQVRVLRFASGLRLVYKPREVDLEWAFGEWLGWFRERGFALAPRAPRVLRRPGHGWEELVLQERLASREQAADYYRRAGALIAFADVLRARDLHVENVVATRDGPVVVDAEMLLQPEPVRFTTAGGGGAVAGSCLDSSLLTLAVAGEPGRDLGGLRPQPQRLGACSPRRWHDLGGDQMRVEPCEARSELRENVVWIGARLAPPEAFRRELAEGYERAYRFVCEHRSEVLSDDGPLRFFAGARTRLVLRRTQEYSTVLELMTRPRNQRSGLAVGLLCEALLAQTAGSPDRPLLWPLVAAEQTALARRDVPRFALPVDSIVVPTAEGEGLAGYLAVSGLDAVRVRIAGLDATDLARQLDRLDRALSPPRPLACLTARACQGLGGGLAAELLESWRAGIGLAEGWALDRGPLGLALLLAAASRQTGGERFAVAALELIEPLGRELDTVPAAVLAERGVGAFSGLGSSIYGLSWLGVLLGAQLPIELAARIARVLDARVIAADRRFDLEGGAAGALLGLLALHEAAGDSAALDAARACAAHLLAHQAPCATGAAWPNPSGLALTGFAHGAAGIARALAALARLTDDSRLRARLGTAVAAAIAYERSLYDPVRRNWPVLARAADRRPGSPPPAVSEARGWRVAWCHGAPGVALSRLYLGLEDTDQLEPALVTTATEPVSSLDHLCCGTLGCSSVLLTAGLRTGEQRWLDAARRLADGVLERARGNGWFCLDDELPGRGPLDPSFLKGCSGVGWQLLRLERGGELPDLLALELPGEHRRRWEAPR